MSALAAVLPLLPLLGALGGFWLSWSSSGSARAEDVPAPARAGDHAASPTARAAGWVAIAPTALTAVLTLVVAVGHGTGPVSQSIVRYAGIGDLELWLGARVDGLAGLIGVLVGVVALAVQVYSATYLRADPRYRSYAAFVSLFTAAMLLVVYSADLLVLLVGWEVMGVCSYFLIGHAWERADARAAAVKAYLVTKAGDIPFLVGVIVLGLDAHTLRIDGVLRLAAEPGRHHLTLAAVLLLGGVVGKSAQFPLHTWLPDAMAGPTPISALIHAATMVAAGVFVVARLYPVFLAAPAALALLAVLAAVTMVGAALAALAQDDIKRVLAYSTVSQLGYMAGALGVGDRDAAVFHLLSHGAFKALLFLAAGVLIHEAGSNDMSVIGALQAGGAEPLLRRRMPLTFVTMTIGLAALAGVPPTSGFFSKESVIGSAYLAALHHAPGMPAAATAWVVLVAGLLTALLTAAYTTRLWLRTFFGDGHRAESGRPAEAGARAAVTGVSPAPYDPDVSDPDMPAAGGRRRWAGPRALTGEAPGSQLWPLVLLAVPALLFGITGLDRSWFARWLGAPGGGRYAPPATPPGPPAHTYDLAPTLVTTIVALLALVAGIALVAAVWRRDPRADPARLLGPLRPACAHAFWFDRIQHAVAVVPSRALARLVGFLDDAVIGGYVSGSGIGARLLGGALRRGQNGNPRVYLAGVLVGVIIIAAVFASAGARP